MLKFTLLRASGNLIQYLERTNTASPIKKNEIAEKNGVKNYIGDLSNFEVNPDRRVKRHILPIIEQDRQRNCKTSAKSVGRDVVNSGWRKYNRAGEKRKE